MTQPDTRSALQRLALALVGACGGLAAWYLSELAARMVEQPRLFLFLVSFVMGGFAALLGIIGPLTWPRALLGALGLASVVAGLLSLSTLRFDAALVDPFAERWQQL